MNGADHLINRTLTYQPSASGSCVVTNEAGLQLVAASPAYLPAVKAAITRLANDRSWRSQYGFTYLIGALLVIGAKESPEELVSFIRTFPDDFKVEIICTVPVFMRDDPQSAVPALKSRPPGLPDRLGAGTERQSCSMDSE